MSNLDKYPRVLIVYIGRINKVDQHGVSIRGWFGDWPKEKLAQIYSGNEVDGDEGFCGRYFKIGKNERRFGKYFFRIKNSSFGQSSYMISLKQNEENLKKYKRKALFKNKFSRWLINTGLWEIVFKIRLSSELLTFIEKFNPQIIYCQGYNLTFTWLPVLINKKNQIPICFQTGDDWPTALYKDSPISFLVKPIVKNAVLSLLRKSVIRIANGKLMASEYLKRYNLPFEQIMMCDDLDRFRNAISTGALSSGTISIIYTGGLANKRWSPIVDLCKAAESLKGSIKILITVYATTIPPEAVNILKDQPNLQILPNPSHEELPSRLKSADILYLPESFESEMVKKTHLSISTKAHLYMMSQVPILIYASPFTGVANYAQEEEWACVVQEQNLNKLAAALKNLIENREYGKNLINKGIEVSLKNHDQRRVRARFLSIMNENVF